MNDSLNRRTKLSAAERNFRSRIAQLSSGHGFFVALSRNVRALVARPIAVVPVGNCISLCTWCRAKRGSFARSVFQSLAATRSPSG